MKNYEKHGKEKSKEYSTWLNIKNRCHNPKTEYYYLYGGRGITVCDEWRNSFSAFYKYMGDRPQGRYSIERIDNAKGYEPGNCKWATDVEQAINHRLQKNNTHGYRGIVFEKNKGLWRVVLSVNCQKIRGGRYKDKEEAAYIRDQFAMQLYGNNAPLNFEYGVA